MKHSHEIVLLDPAKLQLSRDGERAPLRLEYCGKEYSPVRARRAFPQTHPDQWVQLEELEPEGKNARPIGLIRSLTDLEKTARCLVEESLDRTYAVPRIRQIISMKEGRDVVEWEVETDLGKCAFKMLQPHRNVIPTGTGRVILIDDEENRYDIPDETELDERSRRYLERII